MGTTDHPLSRTVNMDDLVVEVTRLVRRGLPINDKTAGVILPNLRSVIARAIHPDDVISRVDSLNTMLGRLLAESDHERYGQPARILFGTAPSMAGTTLTVRRQHAASHLGYDLDHFRKRVEPEVIRAVADLIYRDMLKYKKRAVSGADEFAAYPLWTLTDDDINAQEELSSLVWKFAYAVRSELIGARRQENEPGFETRVAEHYDSAAKFSLGLKKALDNYRALFGPIIRHGGVEYRVEALHALMRLIRFEGVGVGASVSG
jgi:hypothetical protein